MNPVSEASRVCTKCGRVIPVGQLDCLCATRPRYWLHSRETILLFCIIGLVASFVVAGIAARLYHQQRRTLAQVWHRRGTAELSSGKPQLALADFRTALIYGRENISESDQETYQLDLAESLASAGDLAESQGYLLDLWQRAPGDGRVNLDLAHLAVRDGDDQAARRYFEGAINGVWEGNADQIAKDRFDARMELYRYLLQEGDNSSARAALFAAAASLPPDAPLNVQVGRLMLDAGDTQQALSQFQNALRIDPRNVAAQIGAGLASFDLGNDAAAVRYLEQGLNGEKENSLPVAETQQVTKSLDVARAALSMDPFRRGLDAEERVRRTIRSLDAVEARLQMCADSHHLTLAKTVPKMSPTSTAAAGHQNDLSSVYATLIAAKLSAKNAGPVWDPRRIESVMNTVFQAEAEVTAECGPPEDLTNIALARIAGRQQGVRQ